MFKACFVARVQPSDRKRVHLFLQYRNKDLGTTAALPSPQNLGGFCFPIGPENVKPKEYTAPEEYSFTLTGGDGSHLHGFCRSFLPPRAKESDLKRNSNLRYPQVLCIISPFQWFPFYYKVLQIVEALLKQSNLLVECTEANMPSTSPAAVFLSAVLVECRGKPQLGRIIKVLLPISRTAINVSPQRRMQDLSARKEPPPRSSDMHIELQIPPDTGNGSWNAGIPLARLFWHLPSGPLMALLQAMLLERRILMVAQERDTLSAALHAAAALLYPFRWQHIYLPMLPHHLKDYLTAPMPYLIGIPAPQLLPGLKQVGLEEVVYVDLDAGTCTLGHADGPPLDHMLLPWGHQLQAAFQIVYQMLRSPTEFESTPVIGHCMQEYFLKLLGSYREFVEVDIPTALPQIPTEAAPLPGPRQQVQDDGYLRAHGFRFDHLSFVANQRRSERARDFLDLLRHSQMYEVFINERLALAAGGYQTSDAFEAKVTYLQGKRGKVLGRLVAQAGARGVSNFSAVLQRTSTLVKSGVAQIRHAHSPSEDGNSGRHRSNDDTIVPSYSIDMDSPKKALQAEGSANVGQPVPKKDEDPTTFFNHDPDSEEDAPPVASPAQSMSPLRARPERPISPHVPAGQPSTSGRVLSAASSLSSPRATGITNGGGGFDALLNLDGVDGVFGHQSGAALHSSKYPRQQIGSSLLDEDSAGGHANAGGTFDLASWGLELPSISDAASSVAEWASSIQALALSLNSSEAHESKESSNPSPSSAASQAPVPSYDLRNAKSLGTIDPFCEFQSPEALRASSSTKASTAALNVPEPLGDMSSPVPAVSPVYLYHQVPPSRSAALHSSKALLSELGTPKASVVGPTSALWSSGSSNLDDKQSADPFFALDPIAKPSSRVSMMRTREVKQPLWEYTTESPAQQAAETQMKKDETGHEKDVEYKPHSAVGVSSQHIGSGNLTGTRTLGSSAVVDEHRGQSLIANTRSTSLLDM